MHPFENVKILLARLCLLVLILSPVSSWASLTELHRGEIVFRAPEGFVEMDSATSSMKFPALRSASAKIMGIPSGAAAVAIDIKPQSVNLESLDAFREKLARQITASAPSQIKVIKSEPLVTNGRKWGLLEFKSQAVDSEIYNIMVFTPYRGQLLVFNFNTAMSAFPRYGPMMRSSAKSIVIYSE